MVVCKFFLQGNCRYGNSCWNDHPGGGNQGYSLTAQRQLFGGGNRGGGGGGGGGGKPSFRDSFGSNNQNPYKWSSQDAQQQQSRSGGQQGQSGQQLSPADIVKGIGNEVTVTLEGGKMWPFTCMGFEKDMPSLPGFDDISTDEMRLEAYDALKQGNIQVYVQKVESLYNQVNAARQELKNPGLTLKQKLVSFIEDARRQKSSDSSTGYNSLFNDATTLGSSSTSEKSLFGQPQQTAPFGSSSFGQPPSQPQTLFGKPVENQSTFGQSSGQATLFASSTPTTPLATSGFGQSTAQPSFGNPSGVLQQSSFGSNNTTAQTPKVSLFNSGAFSSPTPQTPPTQTAFGVTGNQTLGIASAQTSTQSGIGSSFGTASQPSPFGTVGQPAPSSFGTVSQSAPTPFGAAQPSKTGSMQSETGSVYSPKENLSAIELEQYLAPIFKLGLIPTKPPPKELCF